MGKAKELQQQRNRGRTERQNEGKKGMRHYLFWRLPSPPRSSERFLRFHQYQLNHEEKRHSPISGEREREGERARAGEGERERERERKETDRE